MSCRKKESPLHYVVQSGDATVVGILVGAGADLSLANDKGETPLGLAKKYNMAPMVKALKDAYLNSV